MSRSADGGTTAHMPVVRDPKIHSGDLVFAGTRVPVENLIDYLKGGDTIDQFLSDFPTVQRWQVEALLDLYPRLGGSRSES
jgi:uncharacterized protein (DUF433 family)